MTESEFEAMKQYIAYDADVSGGLKWIKKPTVKANRCKIGDAVGNYSKDKRTPNLGYYHFMFNYKQYRNHRIIYMLHHGFIEDSVQIDHIDKHIDGCNNRIENLRIVTPSENAHNKRKMRNNTSGVTGVTFDSDNKLWKASISINGKRVQKSFKNFEDAKEWRLARE